MDPYDDAVASQIVWPCGRVRQTSIVTDGGVSESSRHSRSVFVVSSVSYETLSSLTADRDSIEAAN